MESSLEETAQALIVLAEHEAKVEALSQGRALPAPPHAEAIHWQLRMPSGRLVARSHGASETAWPDVPLVEGHLLTREFAVYTLPGRDLWLQVAQPLVEFRRAQLTAALIAGSTVVLLGIAIGLVLAWSIQQELRPITEFAQAIDRLGPDATQLEAPRLPRGELIPAYSAIESLLTRLRAKLRSEQAFAAHAAHSLRTPLAGLSAQLEVASASAPAEVATRLRLATDAAHRLAGVVQALLTMARTSNAIRWRSFTAAELGAVAAGRRIAVDATQLEAAGELRGDLDLLAVAVANLVDNAERHGATRAYVRAGTRAGQQFIEVGDDGPGLSTDRLTQIERALRRYDETGEIDTALGLGLTLALSVARAHQGSLGLGCTQDAGPGLCVRLAWPAALPRAPDASWAP
ncbi:MAG TPA: HAMP domain-containing sensor histidine kinase [Burkholderiaceae bacterium]|nr:HAMP domain-containing sensor histidine kinase [Burkholderiaceae bacterium]